MFSIPSGARAALEELLETVVRPTPEDWPTVQFGNQTIGRVSFEIYKILENLLISGDHEINLIHVGNQRVTLYESSPHDLSLELRIVSEFLREKDLIPGWRDEEFAFLDDQGHERFRLERAAFRTFGFLSRAVHINGYTSNSRIWLAKRSSNKATHPNLLDNLAAGGISADETIRACAIRELWEEAGVPRELTLNLHPIGVLVGQRPVPPRGIHHELLFTFDLPLPSEFSPTNQDGEVSQFQLLSFEDAVDLVLAEELTPDAGVVTADFLIRHSRYID